MDGTSDPMLPFLLYITVCGDTGGLCGGAGGLCGDAGGLYGDIRGLYGGGGGGAGDLHSHMGGLAGGLCGGIGGLCGGDRGADYSPGFILLTCQKLHFSKGHRTGDDILDDAHQ